MLPLHKNSPAELLQPGSDSFTIDACAYFAQQTPAAQHSLQFSQVQKPVSQQPQSQVAQAQLVHWLEHASAQQPAAPADALTGANNDARSKVSKYMTNSLKFNSEKIVQRIDDWQPLR